MAKIAGMEVETKVSLTGIITFAMAVIAMVGGWYKFDYRITVVEKSVQELQSDHQQEMSMHERLDASIDRLNLELIKIEQRLNDNHVGTP